MGYSKLTLRSVLYSLLFFLFNISSVEAQKYDFKVYSVNEGLPQGQVHDIIQTNDGFIWMATYGGGLSRFDGKTFKNYTTEDGLRNNSVQQLFEDSSGNLWVANDPGGVVKFQGDSLVNPFPEDSLNNYEVWQIKELRKNEIWFGTYDGGIFILDEGEIHRLTVEDGLLSNSIWDFQIDDDGAIWIATQKGISILDGDSVTNYTTKDGLSGDKVYRIETDKEGNKWFATSSGISIWDGEHFRVIEEINGISLDYVFDVRIASDDKIWIATENKGVFVYDGKKYKHITRENGLSSNYIYTFFEDANNNMWIATNENGVNLYRGDAFIFYDKEFGLTTNEVLSVLMDRSGTLWLGTTDGIQAFDGEKTQQYPLPKAREYENKYIWEIEELSNGHKLFLMPDQTLMEYDGRQFHNFTSKHNLEQWLTYDLFIDSNNRLWIATDEGLFRLEGKDLHRLSVEDGLASNVNYHVQEGEDGTLFIGTSSGLSVYKDNEFHNISIDDGLSHSRINYITQDDKGNLWLGTNGGVSLLEPKENEFGYDITNFGKKHGLRLLATHFLWFDEKGYLWQSTNGGLNRLDVPDYWENGEMNTIHFPLSDEGLGTEFNFKAVTTDSADNAWFGSMDGVLRLDVSDLQINDEEDSPKIHITGIARNSKAVEWSNFIPDLEYKNGRLIHPSVSFPYGEHSYTFSFIGLDFKYPENVEYRYKIQGFEDDWIPATSSNSATYTNLEPGDYTFMVQAINGSQQKSDIATYNFSVAYPFWQTYWFYGFIVLSSIGLVYGYIRFRVGMLEKQKLQQLVDEQTKDLQEALAEKEVLIKEIHHRVKNNLAVISGLLELQRGYAENEFVNRVLSESQRRVQSISMIHEKLYQNERLAEIDFEKYVRELIEIIAYSFNYSDKEIKVNIDIDDFKLGVDQGIPCGLILNELVSNAYEHAFTDQKNGKIDVSAKQQQSNKITLVVKDDGKGLPEDFTIGQDETLGLTLIDTLCGQVQGEYVLENTGNGTRFILEFEREEARLRVPA